MKELSDTDTIKGVIELLWNPKSWVKKIRAVSEDDEEWGVSPTSPNAVKWCLGGAIMRVIDDQEQMWSWSSSSVAQCLNDIAERRGYGSEVYPFVEFNNDPATTHADLMLFLNEALMVSEEQV